MSKKKFNCLKLVILHTITKAWLSSRRGIVTQSIRLEGEWVGSSIHGTTQSVCDIWNSVFSVVGGNSSFQIVAWPTMTFSLSSIDMHELSSWLHKQGWLGAATGFRCTTGIMHINIMRLWSHSASEHNPYIYTWVSAFRSRDKAMHCGQCSAFGAKGCGSIPAISNSTPSAAHVRRPFFPGHHCSAT